MICPPGAACMVLSSPAPKNILFRISELAYCSSIPPRFSEGRFAIVTTREVGMRWTLMCLLTSRRGGGRRNRVVLAPQRLASSWRRCSRIAATTVAIGKVHRGERAHKP